MSTGSGVASVVQKHLERLLHCDWPDLDVYLTPVSDQWAVICVCGPLARDVMQAAATSIDVSSDAFKFLDTKNWYIKNNKIDDFDRFKRFLLRTITRDFKDFPETVLLKHLADKSIKD